MCGSPCTGTASPGTPTRGGAPERTPLSEAPTCTGARGCTVRGERSAAARARSYSLDVRDQHPAQEVQVPHFQRHRKSTDNGADDFEEVDSFEQRTIDFMLEHRETYSAVVDGKIAHSAQSLKNRTKINGEAIYPERGDRDIMREAAMLAESTHKGIGAVLVASRDADFWIVRRSLEEEFGFGVVRTARELSQWA